MSGTRRAASFVAVVVLGVVGSFTGVQHASSSGTPHVALVLEHCDNCGAGSAEATPGDGTTHHECVAVPSSGTTALQTVIRSTFNVYLTSFGKGVNGRNLRWIDGDGYGTDVAADYFEGADPTWGLWIQQPGHKTAHFSNNVIGATHVDPGAVVYLEYNTYSPPDFVQPDPMLVRFRDVCAG